MNIESIANLISAGKVVLGIELDSIFMCTSS